MLRIGIETSVAAFNDAGTGRYARALLQSLQNIPEVDLEFVELNAGRQFYFPQPGWPRKLFVLYWEFIYHTLVLPVTIRRQKLDLVHYTAPHPNYLSAFLPPIPNVLTIHDVIPFLHPEWFTPVMRRRLQRWYRQSIACATHIVASSSQTSADLGASLQVPPEKMTVVYLGISIAEPIVGALPVTEDYLLVVGTLEPRKNLATVLVAYSLLVRQMPACPQLYIVGRQGWGELRLEEKIAELRLQHKVKILGFVSDEQLALLYCQARMLVYPSLYEGFGFPVIEAMKCSCPVITSNVSSIPEVVGDAAIMVDPTNVNQLADAMRDVLHDPSMMMAMRDKGRERSKMFSWQRCAEETLSVYRRVLAES